MARKPKGNHQAYMEWAHSVKLLQQKGLRTGLFMQKATVNLPWEQWFLQSGRYSAKGEKPVQATPL